MGTSSASYPEGIVVNGYETEFVLTTQNNLYLRQYDDGKVQLAIPLGSATKERINEIINHLKEVQEMCPE